MSSCYYLVYYEYSFQSLTSSHLPCRTCLSTMFVLLRKAFFFFSSVKLFKFGLDVHICALAQQQGTRSDDLLRAVWPLTIELNST